MFNLPKLIGHRGVKNLSPENTLDSISLAKKIGLDWVEFDLKISKDLIPISFHDDLLERTTDGKGLPIDYYYQDLKKLDAGYFFYNKPTNIYIPKFEEILLLSQLKKINLNIELKPNKGFERLNVESISKTLKNFSFSNEYYFSSFDLNSLIMMKELLPDSNYGMLVDKFTNELNISDIISIIKKYNFFCCGFNENIINTEIINELLSNDLKITIYSDNNLSVKAANELWSMGITSIFTDDPTNFKII